MPMKVTYYLEVISSWCYWAEPAWAELKQRYAGKVEFGWKLALMAASGLPLSRNQCDWFYRRSGTIMRSAFMLNSGWFEPGLKEYLAPNLVAEAAKEFGATDDRARLAIAHAALREGRKVGNWEESAAVAAAAAGLDATALLKKAKSPEVEARAGDDRRVPLVTGEPAPDVPARKQHRRPRRVFGPGHRGASRGGHRCHAERRRSLRLARGAFRPAAGRLTSEMRPWK